MSNSTVTPLSLFSDYRTKCSHLTEAEILEGMRNCVRSTFDYAPNDRRYLVEWNVQLYEGSKYLLFSQLGVEMPEGFTDETPIINEILRAQIIDVETGKPVLDEERCVKDCCSGECVCPEIKLCVANTPESPEMDKWWCVTEGPTRLVLLEDDRFTFYPPIDRTVRFKGQGRRDPICDFVQPSTDPEKVTFDDRFDLPDRYLDVMAKCVRGMMALYGADETKAQNFLNLSGREAERIAATTREKDKDEPKWTCFTINEGCCKTCCTDPCGCEPEGEIVVDETEKPKGDPSERYLP